MYAVISPEKIHLPPGSVVRMPGTWQDYCALRDSRGDGAIPRIKFRNGEILLMSPLPRHGREANILADVVKVLLDSDNRNYEAGGIEPDYCFYIDNWQAAAGKDRINWQVDPPPDLVIEIDVSTYTAAADYAPYGVPEVWLFQKSGLKIYALHGKTYELQASSRYFPAIDLPALLAQVLHNAATQGTGITLRNLRQQLMS